MLFQILRTHVYESVGREFESLQARQKIKDLGYLPKSFFLSFESELNN
jgi:hypothetical protein